MRVKVLKDLCRVRIKSVLHLLKLRVVLLHQFAHRVVLEAYHLLRITCDLDRFVTTAQKETAGCYYACFISTS